MVIMKDRVTDRQMYLLVVVAYMSLWLLLISYDIDLLTALFLLSACIVPWYVTELPNWITDEKSPVIRFVLCFYKKMRWKRQLSD